MFHFWFKREPSLGESFIYLQVDSIGINDILSIISAESELSFRSVGGYDVNNTWIEHDMHFMDGTHEHPSIPLQVLLMKGSAAVFSEFIKQQKFQFLNYAFECRDQVWVSVQARFGQPSLQLSFPSLDEPIWLDKLHTYFPFLSAAIPDWKSPTGTYFVADNISVKAVFPNVETVFEFHQDGFKTIVDSFNLPLD